MVTYNRLQIGILSRVKFADFLVFRGQVCPQNFGKIVSAGRADFALRISEFDNFTEHKILCLKCMDDLS
jgi:hypothetical protein